MSPSASSARLAAVPALVLAVSLALAALLLARPAAAATAAGCVLTAEAPASYYGIATITSGSIDCASRVNVLRFSITLTRDGAVVAAGERTCHKSATCWSYLIADDTAGDQLWCTTVSARVGSQTLAAVTRCEADPAL